MDATQIVPGRCGSCVHLDISWDRTMTIEPERGICGIHASARRASEVAVRRPSARVGGRHARALGLAAVRGGRQRERFALRRRKVRPAESTAAMDAAPASFSQQTVQSTASCDAATAGAPYSL